MPVAIAASVLGLIVVLLAYYTDEPIGQRGVTVPDWDLLPDPNDIARTEFPLAFPGYEPATVEFHFDLLTRAYADLLAVAPPHVVTRARQRAALRRGITLPEQHEEAPVDTGPPVQSSPLPAPSVAPPVPPPSRTALNPLDAGGADEEALRAEAALAELDSDAEPRS